jgi:hypothetical protein
MTTFQQGPAHGKTLMIRRVPFFLRVVVKVVTNGLEIDALDQIEDTPKADEQIHVYLRQPDAKPNQIHLKSSKKGASGWFARGTYKLSPVQPAHDEYMRDAGLWQTWCKNRIDAQWEPPLDPAWEQDGWLPMWAAAKKSQPVIHALTEDGTIHWPVHWAQDLSGEEQPPFSGWFSLSPSGSFVEVEKVKAWRPS